MTSRQSYSYGSTARKLYYDDENQRVKRHVKKKNISRKVENTVNLKSVFMISCVFALTMFVVYRFNVISEKNLMVINLESDLEQLESNIASIEMDSYTSNDLDYIEAYAKQKLGMQKPDTDQVIYIDTSSNTDVRYSSDDNVITDIINTLKSFFNI